MSEKSLKIAILMSTYNGASYLKEQIDSLEKQDVPVDIFIRDDGSTDKTIDILKEYQSKPNVHIEYGINLGYKKSFMTLLMKVNNYDYYAFCDQDDIWLPNKISCAVKIMETSKADPTLYYSNLKKCNEFLHVYKITDLDKRVLSIQSNILRRSIAGCTMVINNAFREIVASIGIKDKLLVQGHDSYLVSLCCAIDGNVICDKNSYILYRQHEDNTSGSSNGIIKRIRKEYSALKKSKLNEYTVAKAMIQYCHDIISSENLSDLNEFISYKSNFYIRLKIIFSKKYATGNFALTLLGKVKIIMGIL